MKIFAVMLKNDLTHRTIMKEEEKYYYLQEKTKSNQFDER